MCSRRPARSLSDPRGSNDTDDGDFCQPSIYDEFKDSYHRLVHVNNICREREQTAEGEFLSHVSQVVPQRRSWHSMKWLLMTCALFFFPASTFLTICLFPATSVGKEDTEAQDYDADVFLPSKALWLLGSLLFWTLWLFLRLLQMLLWFIKSLLLFISIFASLCHFLSFLVSCVLLLLPHMCDAVFYAITSPVYVYGTSVAILVLILTG